MVIIIVIYLDKYKIIYPSIIVLLLSSVLTN